MLDRRNSLFFIKIQKIIISMTCKSLVSIYQFLSSIESSLFLRNKGENTLSGCKYAYCNWLVSDFLWLYTIYKVHVQSTTEMKGREKMS